MAKMKATRDAISENLLEEACAKAAAVSEGSNCKKNSGTDCSTVYTAHISGNHKPSPYLRRFRLPSLNNSPTQSYEDILSPITDQLPPGIVANGLSANGYSSSPSSAIQTPAIFQRSHTCSFLPTTVFSEEDLSGSLESYRRTLKELELLKQRRPGSSSDYFSMTSSVCSDVSDSGDLNSPTVNCGMEAGERSHGLGAVEDISATLMQISIETEALEKRNKELQEDQDCVVAVNGQSSK